MDHQSKIEFNKIIEESCGLMLEISQIIILDFAKFLQKFASIRPPKKENLIDIMVTDELATFIINMNFLIEVSNFLKGCYEVYQVLIKQVEDMIIPHKLFLIVKQYLARVRINVSGIHFTTANNKKILNSDLKVLKKIQVLKEETEKFLVIGEVLGLLIKLLGVKNKNCE